MPETLPPAVGQLYDPTRAGLPEGASWRLSTRGVELLLVWPNRAPAEVASVRARLTGQPASLFCRGPRTGSAGCPPQGVVTPRPGPR